MSIADTTSPSYENLVSLVELGLRSFLSTKQKLSSFVADESNQEIVVGFCDGVYRNMGWFNGEEYTIHDHDAGHSISGRATIYGGRKELASCYKIAFATAYPGVAVNVAIKDVEAILHNLVLVNKVRELRKLIGNTCVYEKFGKLRGEEINKRLVASFDDVMKETLCTEEELARIDLFFDTFCKEVKKQKKLLGR